MASRLTAPFRRVPATVPALVAVALFVVWETDQGGYPLTHWAPGAIVVVGLLGLTVAIVKPRASDVPWSVRIALVGFAGYTAFSFLSILWAAVPGDAWEGADRTLLYLLVFALFALWPQRGQTAALLLVVWSLALAGLAVFVALRLDSATAASLSQMLPSGRLVYPSGYANANAAQWLMAFWPALLLARSERLPWTLRGLLAGAAVLLAEVALLSQSRGSLYATPVMLVLVFALLPGRARTFALLAVVAIGVGAAAPAVLAVGNHLRGGDVVGSRVHSATVAILAAASVVAVVVAAGARLQTRHPLSAAASRRVHVAVSGAAVGALLIAVAGALVAAGDPIARARHAWDTFKSPRGYAADATGSRLTAGFGSSRYDFYRVALDEFAEHPLGGIGADNFAEQYLAHRRSEETPRYPHSVELRTLSQTGVIGSLFAVIGLAASLLAGFRSLRIRDDPLAATAAAAALAGFAYWLVHGSFDWFFEFAGLGAPAFALLGLVCALAPRRRTGVAAVGPAADGPRRPSALAAALLAATVGVAASASLAAPWLSGLELDSAAKIWTTRPLKAYAQLDDAAQLNPLSDAPYLLAGSIALRYGDLARAERQFASALRRVPGDAYATLERGAIASNRGDRRLALTLLHRAVRLNPRDPLARGSLSIVARGGRVAIGQLNRAILVKALEL